MTFTLFTTNKNKYRRANQHLDSDDPRMQLTVAADLEKAEGYCTNRVCVEVREKRGRYRRAYEAVMSTDAHSCDRAVRQPPTVEDQLSKS